MIVLHDGDGRLTGLQTFPETTEAPHILVDESLAIVLSPLTGAGLQLDHDGTDFVLPADIEIRASQLALENFRTEKFNEIERNQFNALQAGVPFDFGVAQDTVQTSSERDLINISGITVRGLLLRADAVTDAVIEFRAQSNTSYMITGEQAIALGATVAEHNEQIYSKAWQLKDAINAAQSIAELELIQW